MNPTRRGRGLLLAALLLAGAARAETVALIPDKRASWGPTNLFAPITGLFLGGPGYWYSQREIAIDTTPPGAVLDLFYVRRNFQKAYEQADAPVTVIERIARYVDDGGIILIDVADEAVPGD